MYCETVTLHFIDEVVFDCLFEGPFQREIKSCQAEAERRFQRSRVELDKTEGKERSVKRFSDL